MASKTNKTQRDSQRGQAEFWSSNQVIKHRKSKLPCLHGTVIARSESAIASRHITQTSLSSAVTSVAEEDGHCIFCLFRGRGLSSSMGCVCRSVLFRRGGRSTNKFLRHFHRHSSLLLTVDEKMIRTLAAWQKNVFQNTTFFQTM
jgi:hypothetical protein